MTDRCVFAAYGLSNEQQRERVAHVERYLRPLGHGGAEVSSPVPGVLVGQVSYGPVTPTADGLHAYAWGHVPRSTTTGITHGFDGSGVVMTELDRSVRIVVGAANPAACYQGRCGAEQAWSSHAVCAAILAGDVTPDEEAVVDLLALGFVGGDRTRFRCVRAVRPASEVVLTTHRVTTTSSWPDGERLARLPGRDAYAHAEHHLLAALRSHVVDFEAPVLGLTAGADSRVIAVALCELGLTPTTFTWGEPGSGESREARRIAERLGLEHQSLAGGWSAQDEASAEMLTDLIRSDGIGLPSVLGRPQWPARADAFVTGGGGETGRAWYYRTTAACYRDPSVDQILKVWRPELALPDVPTETRARLRARLADWLEQGRGHGYGAWAALDFVYSEQRFRHWGRSMVPATAFPLIAGFGDPEVQRALMSLPLEDKLDDGFHRRFLGARGPDLVVPSPIRQRDGVPRPPRRVMAALRARSRTDRASPLAAAAAMRLREPILEDVLRRESLTCALGATWRSTAATAFAAGDARSTLHGLYLATLAASDDWLASAIGPKENVSWTW